MSPQNPSRRPNRRGLAIIQWLLLGLIGVGVCLFFLWLDDAVRRQAQPTTDQTASPHQLIRRRQWHYGQQNARQTNRLSNTRTHRGTRSAPDAGRPVHSRPDTGWGNAGSHQPGHVRRQLTADQWP